jgi:RimJ/RimL family protein N-acetyltransferase
MSEAYDWQTPAMSSADWPLLDVRIDAPPVNLRVCREQDLPLLASLLPDDAEHDPAAERFSGLSLDQHRRSMLYRTYWHSWGTWSPSSWQLMFVVEHGNQVVGVQALEGEDFSKLRTVDSNSWLVPEVRGRGLGVAMRTGILALAFDHLGAVAAITSARIDNPASLGVSRHLGYEENGVSLTDTPTGVTELRRMRLTADRWRSSGRGDGVTVVGVDACLLWFGVTT